MRTPSAHHHNVLLLDKRIARARARIRQLQASLEHKHDVVLAARLDAAKLRLAQLCLERQRLRGELRAQPEHRRQARQGPVQRLFRSGWALM
jgi:hypothetical protein